MNIQKINKFYKLIIFLCILILTACQPKPKKLVQEIYAEELVDQYILDMKNQYNLHHTSMSWGMYEGVVRHIGPGFGTKEKLDVKRARQLVIELAEELIKRVNESEKLRPYLENFPFTSKNIGILIGYYGKDPMQIGDLDHTYLKNNIIRYKNRDTNTQRFHTIHQESLEEATQKLKSRKFVEVQETL